MKTLSRVLLAVALIALVAGSVSAQQKGRKLPESAYIKSAKIAITTGDTVRYHDAIAMFDSLLMFYGPHPEAYFWLNQMMADFTEKTSSLDGKRPYIQKMALYRDSLKLACANPAVKDPYKKNCSNFQAKADTAIMKYFNHFYNAAVEQLQSVEESGKEMTGATDSTSKAFYQTKIAAQVDSALENVKLAAILDSTNGRAYLLAGTLLERKGDYAGSVDWLTRGLKYTADKNDSSQILLQAAYNLIQQNKYCDAAPYFRQYLAIVPNDTGNAANLAICYNNCKKYDSAVMVYQEILRTAPNNSDALIGLGRYYSEMARQTNEAVSAAREKNNESEVKQLNDRRNAYLDSAKGFLSKAVSAHPDDPEPLREFAVASYLTADYQNAAKGFAKLTELKPDDADSWASLGDSYLYLKQWQEASAAYEKAVALQPDNRQVWQNLYDIYSTELHEPAKAAEAQKHLK